MKNQKYCTHKFCPYHQRTVDLCRMDECQTIPANEKITLPDVGNIINLDEKRKPKK